MIRKSISAVINALDMLIEILYPHKAFCQRMLIHSSFTIVIVYVYVYSPRRYCFVLQEAVVVEFHERINYGQLISLHTKNIKHG